MRKITMSLSARRAWIEICGGVSARRLALSSLSARRAWIEIGSVISESRYRRTSLSARRAWIEIKAHTMTTTIYTVALRKESVDRNLCVLYY